jgi:hypothetical protein
MDELPLEPTVDVYDAIFHRKECIRKHAHSLWRTKEGRGQTAEQNWLQAEEKVLGTPIKLVIMTEGFGMLSHIDKTKHVRDVICSPCGHIIKTKTGDVFLSANRSYMGPSFLTAHKYHHSE